MKQDIHYEFVQKLWDLLHDLYMFEYDGLPGHASMCADKIDKLIQKEALKLKITNRKLIQHKKRK